MLTGVSGAWAQRCTPTVRATSLKTGKYYMLYDAHYASGDVRAGFIGGNGTTIVKTKSETPSTFVNTEGTYVWILEAAPTDGQYYLKNLASGNYYYINGNNSKSSALSSSNKTAMTFTPYPDATSGRGTTNAIAADGTQVVAAEDYTLWQIENMGRGGKGKYWNGDAPTFATWENSHPYAFYEVETVADIEPWGYRIYTLYDGTSATEGSTPYYLTSTGTLTATPSEAEIFSFKKTTLNKLMPAGYAYKITGQTNNKRFTNPDGANRSNNIRTATTNRDDYDAQVFYLNEEDGTFAVRASNVNDNTWHANAFWNVENNGAALPDADYGIQDEKHYVWRLERMVQYNLVFNESTLASYYLSNEGGTAAMPTDSWQRDFCTYSYAPTTIEPSTEVVNVSMNWNGPFDISPNYNDATWYLLHMRQGGYNVKYAESDTEHHELEAVASFTGDDGYYWAFTGNPYEGFCLINKGAGDSKKLYASSTNNGGYPMMNSSNSTKWIVNGNPKNGEANAFGLQISGINRFINDYSNAKHLSLWQDGASTDDGSTLTVEAPYHIWVQQEVSPYFETFGKYFSLKNSAEAVAMGQKWATAVTTCDKATYDELKSFVSDADNIRIPNTGYYRIKNVSSNNYVGYGTAGYAGKGVGLIEVSEDNLSSVLHLTKVSDGVYTISTQGLNVQTQAGNNQPVRATADAGSNHTFTVLAPGVVSIRANQEDAYGYWFRSSWESAPESIITWEVSSDVAKWTVEEATSIEIPLNAANDNTGAGHTYATLCVPFEITGLAGADDTEVKAYAPTKEGDYIVPGTGATTVTAGTPVLLIGAEGATSVTATIGSSYASAPATTNVLTGTFLGAAIDCTAATGTNYVMGLDANNGDRIGFYHVNNAAFALKANRAYLHIDGGSVKGFAINWDQLADGVNSLAPSSSIVGDGHIYNLAGQRVSKLQRGVNIVNGRKVIVK